MDRFVTPVVVFAASVVLSVFAVPGFAQSNTSSTAQSSYSAINVVNLYDAALNARYDGVTMPANLTVTPLYLATVRTMLERSPTFRRQCARLAAAGNQLTIELRGESRVLGRRAPAWTTVRRHARGLHAVMTITPAGHTPELIAHEVEHVIEQVDGVDLASMSRLGATGVRQCDCGDFSAFETTRAIRTGQRVAREVAERSQ